jgi:hypothetical protein
MGELTFSVGMFAGFWLGTGVVTATVVWTVLWDMGPEYSKVFGALFVSSLVPATVALVVIIPETWTVLAFLLHVAVSLAAMIRAKRDLDAQAEPEAAE